MKSSSMDRTIKYDPPGFRIIADIPYTELEISSFCILNHPKINYLYIKRSSS